MILSGVILVATVGVAWLCARRPVHGVLALVASVPFYALLRESSAGSPIYFVWPYVMVAVLVGTMTLNEVAARLTARGVVSPRRQVMIWGSVGVALALAILEVDGRVVSIMLTDVSLAAVGPALASRSFQSLAVAGMLGMVGVLVLFLRAMRAREGRWSAMDVAIVVFLIYGLLQIVLAYLRNGVLFTGLNGFRYYFAGALVYVPARYFLISERDRRWFTYAVVGVVSLAGVQMLFESYLLNVRGWPPDQLPWVGHLAGQFEYLPSPKAFFSGAFVPLGPLYFTHVSGLVVLFGLCLILPLALAADDRRRFAAGLILVAFFVVATHWTSRTGLLLLVATSSMAIALTRASWRRRLMAVLVVIAATVTGARYLIPGAVYDIEAERQFLFGRAVPNLLGAIADDLFEITGWRVGDARDGTGWRAIGWELVGKGGAFQREPDADGGYHLRFMTGDQGIEFRHVLPADAVEPGDQLTFEVQFEGVQASEAGLQIFQGDRVAGIVKQFEAGQIGAWAMDFVVGASRQVTVDIDISANADIKVRYARLITPRGVLRLLGFGPEQALPQGWSLSPGDAVAVPALQLGLPRSVQGALLLTGGGSPTTLTLRVPEWLDRVGQPLIVTAEVRALTEARVTLALQQHVTDVRDSAVLALDEVRTFTTALETRADGAPPRIELEFPASARLELLEVRIGQAADETTPVVGGQRGLPDGWTLTSTGQVDA